ncbi:MAG: ABC transporter ATP-binding protein [Candidatus Sumerlaea chitinivorans]|uniref:Branched-chain amino acid transport ATP-binding protein LivF n=1 Tax=Sumerlaea chitinivorans TaxID=2250252 RepID=A0A2Z4Y659_SUMC1|nr:Branched-chain amino acid transport ATP-binding protein LivF [Candidatus Sumerlaea chitinivorans]MCX7964638.1 ABC transporter ATP-binding protein [Candidatus Sumerlaea chitinivorans]
MTVPVLSLANVESGYGALRILKGISMEVHRGEIVTLIGSNGAGKTTTLNTICGVVRVRRGTILFDGSDISRMDTPDIARLGIAHVPEGRRLFPELTVRENLEMGAFLRTDSEAIRADMEEMYQLFPILRQRANQRAGSLSGGEQQMCAIARGLMSRPQILLLDEPSLGLAPKLVGQIFEIIQEINRRGTTVLLVEQNAHMALTIAHRGYVIATGEITLSGTGAELLANDMVKKLYLGEA